MKQEVLSRFPHLWLTCLGLLLFVSVFLGALFWVFRRGSRRFYDQLAGSILQETK